MAQYVWVIAVIALVGLVQFAVYRYLRRQGDTSPFDARAVESSSAPRADAVANGEPRDRDPDREAPRTGRRCPTCGAVNDPAFTFCRRCVGRVGA